MHIMRYISFAIVTITLIFSPLFVFAQADPHTNITPIEDQVEQNIDAFNEFVRSGDFTHKQLSEAVTDLQAVLDFYVETLE